MRKGILFMVLSFFVATAIKAQTKGNKVGYIDMEYILQNIPDYIEAKAQLEQKAQKWKQEIEAKKLEINKLTEALKVEKPLLTPELIEERETEIKFLETEKLDYQQKRFGPNGDLIMQKAGLVKPLQDQVFTAVQDIVEAKKYDFIFDKSSDLTILFAAKRFDISDQVIRILNRTEKREQLTKKQQKEEEAKEKKEDELDENPVLAEREKALLDKKAAREKLVADKKVAQEEARKQNEEKRKQSQAEREAKKNGTVITPTKTEAENTVTPNTKQKPTDINGSDKTSVLPTTEEVKPNVYEERKKALEEKRKKTLEEREANKKAAEDKRLKEIQEKEALKKANDIKN